MTRPAGAEESWNLSLGPLHLKCYGLWAALATESVSKNVEDELEWTVPHSGQELGFLHWSVLLCLTPMVVQFE